jgi:hypothetical protein
MALSISIRADATQFSRTIAGVRVQMSGLAGGMANATAGAISFGASLAKVGLAVGAVGAAMAVAFIKSASQSASSIESLTMQFETLLGSSSAAKKRMEEIKDFAASTPFEVANLSETSKLLQTLGGDLLATGAGLRLVGDAASIAGQPIQEVGLHVGRLFNAITSGTSAGESIARLQELGLISGKVKLEFESLAASQKKGTVATLTSNEALKKLQEVLSKTDGAMVRLSATTEGKLSNMGDAISNLKVAFGTGFNDGLKVALDATNNFLPQLEGKFTKMGKLFGSAINQAVSGDYEMFVQIGVVIGEALIAGAKSVFNVGVSSVIRDGIGGYISAGGRMTGNDTVVKTGQLVSAGINKMMGPGQSMGDTIKEQFGSEGLTTAVKALERMAADSSQKEWAEQLRRQTAATEELVRQGKDATKENMQILFSR